MTFTLKFTEINPLNGKVFNTFKTKDHGWKSKEHFLESLSKYNGRDSHEFIPNGYKYLNKDISVIRKVEAVDE